MGFYLSPLVDIKEIDLTTTIQAVSTNIGCIVVRNPFKGPEMKRTLIANDNILFDTYGKPTEQVSNYVDMLSAFGALKYMNILYATAVRPADATFAGIKSTVSIEDGSVSFDALPSTGDAALTLDDFASLDPDDFASEVFPDGPVDVIAYCRGTYGNNIRVAFINASVYDKVVRQEVDRDKYTFSDQLLTLDSPIEKGNDKEFIIIVQELQEGKDASSDMNWDIVEYWNVSTDISSVDDEGRTKEVETVVNAASKYIRIALNESQKNANFTLEQTEWSQLGGGSNGTLSDPLMTETIDALNLYRNSEEIDINVIIDSDKPETVKKHILSICAERKDCMGILDCRYDQVVNNKGSEVQSIVNWRKGLTTKYATDNLNINSDRVALYGNWLEVYDKWNRKYRWVPASGYVAGIYANTDQVSDPWFAPAGLNRAIMNNVRRLAFNPVKGERDILYKNGVNPIISRAGKGKTIWGQKTLLDKDSAFNRINVRRLFLVMEKAISTASEYFLFEPNDPFTRHQLTSMIEPFLRDVKARRGIYDYQVVCDARNNTPERIDRNELWVDILVKPTKAAEYIVLRFTATKTDASFTEIADSLF